MKFLRALFKKPNGIDDLDEMRKEFSAGGMRVCLAARRLARAAETVSRHKRERDLAAQIERFRKYDGAL